MLLLFECDTQLKIVNIALKKLTKYKSRKYAEISQESDTSLAKTQADDSCQYYGSCTPEGLLCICMFIQILSIQ